MPQAVKKRAATALEKNADELVFYARRDAPKDDGELEASIVKEEVPGLEGLAYEVKTDKFYSRFQEFGTVRFPAQPFFFVNFRALRPRFNRRMGRALRQGIKDALGK